MAGSGRNAVRWADTMAWLLVIVVQLQRKGFSEAVVRRMFCFSLFWHVIDVVWIAVFSFVYLIGSTS